MISTGTRLQWGGEESAARRGAVDEKTRGVAQQGTLPCQQAAGVDGIGGAKYPAW